MLLLNFEPNNLCNFHYYALCLTIKFPKKFPILFKTCFVACHYYLVDEEYNADVGDEDGHQRNKQSHGEHVEDVGAIVVHFRFPVDGTAKTFDNQSLEMKRNLILHHLFAPDVSCFAIVTAPTEKRGAGDDQGISPDECQKESSLTTVQPAVWIGEIAIAIGRTPDDVLTPP